MALIYDNLKGMFKEDATSATPKGQKNRSGIMTKELSSLSRAGPEGHTLAYITPDEEKLLQKATGKETMMTAYGIPTYQTDMTLEEMESKIAKERLDEIMNEAIKSGKGQSRSGISKAGQEGILSPQETDEALTKSSEEDINFIYDMLIRDEYAKMKEVRDDMLDARAFNLMKRVGNKVKSLIKKPEEGESAMKKEEFNPNRDYHLNKFLEEQQQLMQSKEPYFPPQP